jgi:16S rRNA (cytosine1402-N4)-methyltransferase
MVPQASWEEPSLPVAGGHRPVLAREVLDLLAPRPGDTVVDGTLGAGGHAELLLEAIGPMGRLIGVDRDPDALALAAPRLSRFGPAFVALRGDHRDLPRLLGRVGLAAADRILLDLGLSSMQLDDPRRGFSFTLDGPLDMRMDPDGPETAAQLVARLDERQLRETLWRFGEEPRARAIARAIVRARRSGPLRTTRELARIVERASGSASRGARLHPATRTFQALRIAVNDEIEGLAGRLTDLVGLLRPGGRIAVISFHSLEDRAVKSALRELSRPCTCPPRMPVCGCGRRPTVRVLTPRPIGPSAPEVGSNPRSRSAKLRAAEKL